MRALLVLVLALGILYSGYWVVGSTALETSAASWLAQQSTGGRQASYSDLEVQGFPNRFDLTVTDPRFADPVTGISWTAPFVQVFSMTWKPWHLIAILPNTQTFATPEQTITLASSNLKSSLKLVPGTALALDSIIVEGVDLGAHSTFGWAVSAAKALLATRQDATLANGHQITLTISSLIPDPSLMATMAATSPLPSLIETAQIDLVAGFTAPLDRLAGRSNPQLSALTVKQGLLRWGNIDLTVKGALVADAEGFAKGRIEVKLTNWQGALAPAVAMGLIKPEIAPTVENMMALMAQQSGDPNVLDLALVMSAGRMSLGPLPLGPAPRMVSGPQG